MFKIGLEALAARTHVLVPDAQVCACPDDRANKKSRRDGAALSYSGAGRGPVWIPAMAGIQISAQHLLLELFRHFLSAVTSVVLVWLGNSRARGAPRTAALRSLRHAAIQRDPFVLFGPVRRRNGDDGRFRPVSGGGVVPTNPTVEVPTPSIGRAPLLVSLGFRRFAESPGRSFLTTVKPATAARAEPITARNLKFL